MNDKGGVPKAGGDDRAPIENALERMRMAHGTMARGARRIADHILAQPEEIVRMSITELAEAGMNTVHLLPSFDIATIEEDRALQVNPVIPSAGPASPDQQAAVTAVGSAIGGIGGKK